MALHCIALMLMKHTEGPLVCHLVLIFVVTDRKYLLKVLVIFGENFVVVLLVLINSIS
jgi:hypothetical protein